VEATAEGEEAVCMSKVKSAAGDLCHMIASRNARESRRSACRYLSCPLGLEEQRIPCYDGRDEFERLHQEKDVGKVEGVSRAVFTAFAP
jgi:hypothetical protein